MAAMEEAFEQDVNTTFTLKVKIYPNPTRYSWYHEDDPSWYGRNGRYDVEGFESDFTDGEGTIVIIGHEHDWDYENAVYVPHTDTEDGYWEYTCMVEGCTKKEREIIPAGHVWETTSTQSPAYAEPVAAGTAGAMKSIADGQWYLPHYAVVKGIKVNVLNMGMLDDTPTGRLMRNMLLAFAEFERDMILQRTREGKEAARKQEGYREGRKAKYTETQIRHAVSLLKDNSYSQVVKLTGISKSTLIRANKKIDERI